MKTLLTTILVSTFFSITSNASLDIKSIVLNDSTIISGAEVSAITLNVTDFSVNSIETLNGDVIDNSEIKLINLFNVEKNNGPFQNRPGKKSVFSLMSVKHGGDDSGG